MQRWRLSWTISIVGVPFLDNKLQLSTLLQQQSTAACLQGTRYLYGEHISRVEGHSPPLAIVLFCFHWFLSFYFPFMSLNTERLQSPHYHTITLEIRTVMRYTSTQDLCAVQEQALKCQLFKLEVLETASHVSWKTLTGKISKQVCIFSLKSIVKCCLDFKYTEEIHLLNYMDLSTYTPCGSFAQY